MLHGEFEGVKSMHETQTIRVPTPICACDPGAAHGFAVFEYLPLGGSGSAREMGKQLARMHRVDVGSHFGFHVDNTIGKTPQKNTWSEDFSEFWLDHRFDPMMRAANQLALPKEI
eukprot:6331699-Prymnesium_polylepis.1